MSALRFGVVVLVLLLAGCGASPAPLTVPANGHATPDRTAQPTSAVSVAAGAGEVARELLALAVLPPGATSTATPSTGTLSRPDVEPASPALADYGKVWSVPLSMSAAADFLSAHVPSGTRYSGRSSAVGRISAIGVIDSATPLPAGMCFAQLVFSIAPDGADRALVRADGQAMTDCAAGPHS